jgi:hypothetical protein
MDAVGVTTTTTDAAGVTMAIVAAGAAVVGGIKCLALGSRFDFRGAIEQPLVRALFFFLTCMRTVITTRSVSEE